MRRLVRGGALLVVLVALLALALTAAVDGAAPVVGPPATPALAAVEAGADVIVAGDPLHHLDPGDPLGTLAYQVDALARASRLFATSDPARSQRYISLALNLADYLVAHDARAPGHQLGWGLPRAWDAFDDGTVNPRNQVYAFQTALVSWALLDAYTVADRPVYLATVERAMAAYLPYGSSHLGLGCSNCFMFWYSTSPNDAGRYVKNTNVLIGLALATLYHLTGKARYQALARAVYNEETYEIVRHANYSYFGIRDPQYSPLNGPDAHIVLETFAYSQLAGLLGLSSGKTRATLDRMDAAFWNCGSACFAGSIKTGPGAPPDEYIQFMTCYPATFDPLYAPHCAKTLAAPNQPTRSPFPLAGLLYALPDLPAK